MQMNIINGIRAALELRSLIALISSKYVGPPVNVCPLCEALASDLQARAFEDKQQKQDNGLIWRFSNRTQSCSLFIDYIPIAGYFRDANVCLFSINMRKPGLNKFSLSSLCDTQS